MKKIDAVINDLIKSILNLSGKKIITLSDRGEPFAIDIDENGKFGYDKNHELVFKIRLKSVLNNGGGMIIRQFLQIKTERVMADGTKAWVPRKNIYGIHLSNGIWMPLPKAEVEIMHCTDAETGKPIGREEGVSFMDFPVLE